MDGPRIAICHDWLDSFGGAERQVEELAALYPSAELFTVYDLRRGEDAARLPNTRIHTSGLSRLPGVRRYYRSLLLLSIRAVERFDVNQFDVVFSVSSAISKGVITRAGQPHIAYVNSPARYAWGMQAEYLENMGGPLAALKRAVAQELLHRFRLWDMRTVAGVDLFCANSRFIQQRVWKAYRRRSYVLYPPVDTGAFTPDAAPRDDFYVTASRMVPYKRMPLIVEAFARTPERRLVVIGDGPEMAAVKRAAAPNIEILGYQPFESMLHLFRRARAFIFAANEDFGIVPLEAQACGTPVIALGRGGTRETIRALGHADRPTGVWFERQRVDDILGAVDRFERSIDSFDPETCHENARAFGVDRFRRQVQGLVDASLSPEFHEDMVLGSADANPFGRTPSFDE